MKPEIAKVGVEGSNPFARSNQFRHLWRLSVVAVRHVLLA